MEPSKLPRVPTDTSPGGDVSVPEIGTTLKLSNVGKWVDDRPANQHDNVECENDGKRCEHILFGH
jgi:hypothetical protein